MFSIFKKKPSLKSLIPNDSIDIHSHLLPGLDDGAKSLDETKVLLKKLRKIGFSNCIATPHTLPEVWDNTSDGITAKFNETKLELSEATGSILTRAASEYMINEAFLERIQSEPLLTLKDNCILIEMSYLNPPLSLTEIIFEIKLKGYQPILAHPERYLFYHNQTKTYDMLKNLEVQFQLNLLSTVGYYGNSVTKIADYLLKDDFIDYVGSDVHHLKHIQAFENKIQIKSEEKLREAIERNKYFI